MSVILIDVHKTSLIKVSESVIGAVDNILNIPESTFETPSSQQVSKDILATISTLIEVIQKASTNNFTYRYVRTKVPSLILNVMGTIHYNHLGTPI